MMIRSISSGICTTGWIGKKNLNLLFDKCRGKIEKEDVETVDGTTTNHHWPLINKPSWRLLVL